MRTTEKEPVAASTETGGLSLENFWESFKSMWWIVAITTVAFALVVYIIFVATFVPMYKSTARFTILPLVNSDASSGASVYNFNFNETLSAQMAATFPHIINGGFLTEIISADIGRPINGEISAKAIEDTNIFEIYVTSDSAQDAYDILISMINNYPKIAEHVIGDTRMNMLAGSEPVLSDQPYNSGKVYTYVAIGAILGLAFGVLLVVIKVYTSKTVMNKKDIEVAFNGKSICEIPFVASKRSNKKNTIPKASSQMSGFSESIRVLKQRVKLNATTNGIKIIGMTSAVEGEGKTTISYNLARSLSTTGKKVILVDTDLNKRSIQAVLNRKNQVENVGISEIITGKLQINECINSVSDTFDVLFAGSEQVKFVKRDYIAIFEYLRTYYDYVIVDMPACGTAESASLADFCDGLLFTIKWNSTDRNRILNAIKYLAFSDTSIIGYILNCVKIESSSYGGYKYYGKKGTRRYGYGYGYGYDSYGYGREYGSSDNSHSSRGYGSRSNTPKDDTDK